jgi:cell division protein FtsL
MLKIGVGVMVVALVSLGVVYISTVIRVSVRGYAIRELQTELNALEQTARENDQKVAQLQSVERVQERMGDLNMVAIGPVEYLKAQQPVALAR